MTQPNNSKKMDPYAQIKEMWQFVRFHRWWILCGGVFLSAVALVVISQMPRYYKASTTVLVDPQKIPWVKDIDTMDPLTFNALSQQVLSTTRLRGIVNELHLCSGRCSMQAYVENMGKNITVDAKSGGAHNMSTFTISYQASNPKMAAEVVTRLAEGFMGWDMTTREQQAAKVTEFLTAQQAEAKDALEKQEARLEDFKVQHALELGTAAAPLTRWQMQEQSDAAALDRLEREKTKLMQAATTEAQTQTASTSGATGRGQLEAQARKLEDRISTLRMRYSDEYPDVAESIQQLAAVKERLAQLPAAPMTDSVAPGSPNAGRLAQINRDIERLQARRQSVAEQIGGYRARLDEAPQLQMELNELSRGYQDAMSRYTALFAKDIWAKTANELLRRQEPGRFAVLDPAYVPEVPVRSRLALLTPLVIPFCFILAVAAAIVVEKIIKQTTGTEAALREQLPESVAILGRIPVIETPQLVRRQRQVAALASVGALLAILVAALYAHKMPLHTFAATGSVLCVLAAAVIVKTRQRKTEEGLV